jgi:hypothetical protein
MIEKELELIAGCESDPHLQPELAEMMIGVFVGPPLGRCGR